MGHPGTQARWFCGFPPFPRKKTERMGHGTSWRLLSFGDVNGMVQLESEERFGWKHDLFVAGEGAASCAGAAARKCANGRALAPPGEPANESTQACAAADEACGTLAFALFCPVNGAGGDR